MDRSQRIFRLIAFVAQRHLAHFQAQVRWIDWVSRWLLEKANEEMFSHAASVHEQAAELHELKALDAALRMKRAARLCGQWQDRHGAQLNGIAQVLIVQHGWDPDEVGDFVQELTDGFFNYGRGFDESDE